MPDLLEVKVSQKLAEAKNALRGHRALAKQGSQAKVIRAELELDAVQEMPPMREGQLHRQRLGIPTVIPKLATLKLPREVPHRPRCRLARRPLQEDRSNRVL